MKNALVIGSQGTIGQALAQQLSDGYAVTEINQNNCDYSEAGLQAWHDSLAELEPFSLIICCIGTLHNELVEPEKKLDHLSQQVLSEYFQINTILPALCLKQFHSLLDRTAPSSFAFLSAMVGSIGDNQLGGWYGYRSSKAALNMMVKTASVEVKRFNKQACLAVIHPGTTQGPLSKPFARGVSKDKYYTPEQSAQRIVTVLESLTPEQSGSFYNWDGSIIPW